MKIISIEPTPSPNTMKIILNEELATGKSNNYKKDNLEGAPELIRDILTINGVKGVYHVADFLAVERNAKFDWKEILPQVRSAFGEQDTIPIETSYVTDHYGEVKVFVQMFKNIPMQVKLTDGETERRLGLSSRFQDSIIEVQKNSENVVLQRTWNEHGVRYGSFEEIGKEVIEEIEAAYPKERIEKLIQESRSDNGETKKILKSTYTVTLDMLNEPEWEKRYAYLDQMNPTINDLPVLEKALHDSKASIRRLATVYLGMVEDKKVLPLLYLALKDKTVTVRRTAGDCLSDIGDSAAIPEMITALKDPNKLVRWRAAMFLFEVGDESALPALKASEEDSEFEVSLQIKMAIERIEGGEEAKGSVWKQMTESRKQS